MMLLFAAGLPLWSTLAGCSLQTHKVGLVAVEDGRVLLRQEGGKYLDLVVTGEGQSLRYLDGCIAAIDGPRMGRKLFVKEWAVTDGGDGSAPFLGALRRHGGNWVIDDRTTGRPVILDPASLPAELLVHEGKEVMVSGYVVGPQTIRVVRFRVLAEP